MKNTIVFFSLSFLFSISLFAQHDYALALKKSTYFYGGQRCGDTQSWVHDACHLEDGDDVGNDFTGGWHDCGDHIKFGHTGPFTAMVLLMGYELSPSSYADMYSPAYSAPPSNGIPDVLDEIKVETDYLMKTISNDTIYYQVGDNSDHRSFHDPAWQSTNLPASDGGNPRTSYFFTQGGANIAGEAAAALAMMSVSYAPYDATYAANCLTKAIEYYEIGKAFPGAIGEPSNALYSAGNWADDMALGAVQLYKTTNNNSYLVDAENYYNDANFDVPNWNPITTENVTHLVNYELYKITNNSVYINDLSDHLNELYNYQTSCGYMHFADFGSLYLAANAAFTASLFHSITNHADSYVFAKRNIDFILGTHDFISDDAPADHSFLMGYNELGGGFSEYPHDASSFGKEADAWTLYYQERNNPGSIPFDVFLTGALVGGPRSECSNYDDNIFDHVSNEVCIYYNSGLVGALAFIHKIEEEASSTNAITTCSSISDSSDDAEEDNSGSVDLVSSDLELSTDGSAQEIGMRFNGLNIPQGAIISTAYIQFTVDEAININPCNLNIYGEDTDNSSVFAGTNNNISARTKTNANISWSPVNWNNANAAGFKHSTPDIASVIQEIVDRSGFSSSSSITVILNGSGARTAESYDGDSSAAAKLCIKYMPGCPTLGTSCDDGNPNTSNDVEDGACNCAGTPNTTTLDIAISNGNDDVEEGEVNGNIDASSGDLELVYNISSGQDNQTVGLRFLNVNVPNGATINNAYIQFTVDETSSGTANLLIQGHDIDNAPIFSTTNYDVSNRIKTTASVNWNNISAWNTVGDANAEQQTANISSIIQEITNRAGWNSGQNIAIILTGSGLRTSESYEGSVTGAPILHLEYTSTNCVDTDNDGECDETDNCPNDPNKIEPGICGCGVSDLDTDNDGTADCNDACPNDPNKTSAGECGCGLADTDSDADGTADCNDGCPNDPNKTSAGECGCGLADTDSDADGIADCNDNCPFDLGNDADNDGFCAPEDCNDNDPLIYPGANCDDGNASTSNDVYDENCNCTGTLNITTLNIPINNGDDDVEEGEVNGNIDASSGDLELVYNISSGQDNQTVGLRFLNVNIPNGATINNAYIQFTVDETSSGTANLLIQGHDIDDAPIFSTTNYDVSNRIKTTASVNWNNISAWNTVGDANAEQQTADISSIVQEITSRPGWNSGQNLAIILTGSGLRTAESYEGSVSGAPALHVEFTYCLDTDNDGECDETDACPNDPNKIEPGICGCGFADDNIATLNISVNNGNDDVEEGEGNGNIDASSGDLELVYNISSGQDNQTVGLRFLNVNIPNGAIINNAYVQFTVDETSSGTADLLIQGHADDNAPAFSTTNYDVSNRTKTAASVNWSNIPPWNTVSDAGIEQQTTDISSIIQEITSRSGWNSGQNIAIILTGTGLRTAESYEGSVAGAPILHIQYIDCIGTGNSSQLNEAFSGYQLYNNKENRFDFNLSPNPAKQEVTIVFKEALPSNIRLKLTDFNGKMLREYEVINGAKSLLMDISKIHAGTYIIHLKSKDYNIVKKLVIIK